MSTRWLSLQQKENLKYNKGEKYIALLKREEEKNKDQFYKWDQVDYLVYNTLNEKIPQYKHEHIIWFPLNQYDPDVRLVDIDQYCLK